MSYTTGGDSVDRLGGTGIPFLCKDCGDRLFTTSSKLSRNGNFIPLNFDDHYPDNLRGDPHNCPMRGKNKVIYDWSERQKLLKKIWDNTEPHTPESICPFHTEDPYHPVKYKECNEIAELERERTEERRIQKKIIEEQTNKKMKEELGPDYDIRKKDEETGLYKCPVCKSFLGFNVIGNLSTHIRVVHLHLSSAMI